MSLAASRGRPAPHTQLDRGGWKQATHSAILPTLHTRG